MKRAIADSMEQELIAYIAKAKDYFKQKITSVILFGSVARNEDSENSDIDILIVCKKLPEDWRKRDAISIDIGRVSRNYGRAVHTTLATEEEIKFSVRDGAPLLLEIASASRILQDNGFFTHQIEIFRKNMVTWKARKINRYMWEVPGLAVRARQ